MDPVSKARQSTAISEKQRANLKPWPKGVSGNPTGRPRKNHVTRMYERLLSNPQKRKEIEEAVFNRLVSNRMVGSLELRECADRTEGKVSQEMTVNGELTLSLANTLQERRKRLGNGNNSES